MGTPIEQRFRTQLGSPRGTRVLEVCRCNFRVQLPSKILETICQACVAPLSADGYGAECLFRRRMNDAISRFLTVSLFPSKFEPEIFSRSGSSLSIPERALTEAGAPCRADGDGFKCFPQLQ